MYKLKEAKNILRHFVISTLTIRWQKVKYYVSTQIVDALHEVSVSCGQASGNGILCSWHVSEPSEWKSYLRGSEVAETGVGTLDGGLLHDTVAGLPVTHVVRAKAVLSVEQVPANHGRTAQCDFYIQRLL